MTSSSGPSSSRIDVLDVLRGIALLGMFMVHFTDHTTSKTALGYGWHRFVTLFFEDRFWTMFAILFGVGFAVQFRRAEAAGARFVPRFFRRAAALFAFGLIAEIGFGFHVLTGYAIWSVPLLFIRRWSTKALVALLIVCAMSTVIYRTITMTYAVATVGEEGMRAARQAENAANAAFQRQYSRDLDSPSYGTVVAARMRHMPYFYSRPWFFLPVNEFALFLIGVIGLRLGLFDRPGEHQRLIAGLMIYGVVSWAVSIWEPWGDVMTSGPVVLRSVVNQLAAGGGLVRDMWLAFTYIGAVLLLAARAPAWLGRLAPFGWTGRMALSNYMLQVAVLDLTFSNYALGLAIAPWMAPVAALALFAVDAAFSRRWLTRYQYGPLEWMWRSVTYWRRQPMIAAP